LSPDGKWALALNSTARRGLIELPIGAGESRAISTGDVQVHQAFFFPDARHILELGSVPGGHGLRLWLQGLEEGAPRPITPEGVSIAYRSCISPDGQQVAAQDPGGKITIYPLAAGSPRTVPNIQSGDVPVQWTPDGKSLLVGRREVPSNVFTIDLATGQRKLFRSFSPADPTGLFQNSPPQFSLDLKSYVYTYERITSDLYVVDGLK
jgi:Tol biopolymer transport system component